MFLINPFNPNPKLYVMRKLSFLLTFLLFVGFTATAQMQITGQVTNAETGDPIPGVSVVVKGQTTMGTATDMDGNYTLEGVPSNAEVLVFSFVGMQQQEVAINGRNRIDIQLVPSVEELDEVVVTGYGVKKKGSITGSATMVKADKLEKVPAASFDGMLQGQVAGLLSISSSGRPGAESTVRIRGLNSINAGNDPLYVVDGVPVSGNFSILNPNDIEQITVMKDASMTSIYGARASNGVIVITTKRGRKAKETEIEFSAQYGMDQIARNKFEMMNTTQKLDYEEALGLRTPGSYNRDSLEQINTNWLDAVLADANTQSYQLSARGGNEDTRFFASGQYYDQGGILPRSDFKRYALRVNLDHDASDRLSFGSRMYLGFEDNKNTVAEGGYANNVYNPVFSARLLNPYLQPRVDGEYTTKGLPWGNPLEQIDLNDNGSNRLKLTGSIFANYEIIEGLSLRSTLGGDMFDFNTNEWLNPNSAWGMSVNGSVEDYFSRNRRINVTNLLNYDFKLGAAHTFNAKLGQESIQNYYKNFRIEGKGLPNDKVKVVGSTTEADGWGGNITEFTVASYFGALSYNYQEKYFLDLSYRRDGSSRFGEDVRWGNFWSVGVSWNAHKESFLQGFDAIQDLKLSGSVGTVGNYDIGNYLAQALYAYDVQYNNANGSRPDPAGPGNPELTWERLLKANINLNFSVYDFVNFNIDVYRNLTTDMLFEVPTSLTSGWDEYWDNVAEMENRGIEVEADFNVLQSQNLLWNLTANFSYNQNQVKSLYGDKEEILESGTIIKEGYPYGQWYEVEWAGVNPATGEAMWYDKDGNIVNYFSENNRRLQAGKSYLPPYSGGLTNTFSYKGITLSAQFSWMAEKYLFNNTAYFIESNGQFAAYNQDVSMLDYWKEPGDVAANPYPDGTNYFDTRFLEDASFIRMKDLTLSYQFSDQLMDKLRAFKSVRIYAKARNLLTFSPYQGIDPEFYGRYELNAYPHVKTIILGLDFGL